MQVQRIQNNNYNTSFGAKIAIKTEEMKLFMDYIHRYTKAPEGFYNSTKDLELTNKIFVAFEKHPSKEEIVPDVAYFRNSLFGARGTLESSKAAFIDTEPARSDSIAPIKNIFRRILDPENKKQFNRLVGEEHSSTYDSWWKENISPIWDDIRQNFREETFFKENYDREFNADFNRESGKAEDFFKQKGNFWARLYKRIIMN